jgi:uncharacterized protein
VTFPLGRVIGALLGVALLLAFADPAAASFVAPPAPSRWATDSAGFLSPATRDRLDAELQAYEQRTGHQVLVYIGTTTGAVPLEEYTVNAFAAWKVGRKGLDDGLVLFIFAKDHRVRIEVGYGLEPVVTDAAASEIIRNVIVPAIRAGDNDAAVTDGVAKILATIDGTAAPEVSGGGVAPAGPESPAQPGLPSLISRIFIGLALFGFIILFIRSPGFALFLLYSLMSGGRGGSGVGGGGFSGGGGGGGGFSGGGGGGGGGGASGSW